MTIEVTIQLSPNANDPKTTATHKMRHDGTLARAGSDGCIELWAFGQWVHSDHKVWVLNGNHSWFVKLSPGEV